MENKMLLYDARKMAISLMDEHGLKGWTFKFSRGKNILGHCQYTRAYINHWRVCGSIEAIGNCNIALSHYFTELNDEHIIKDTILHEIAHALSPGHGHDGYWRSVCRQIGASPERLAPKTVKAPTPKYRAVCSDCGKVFRKHRMRKGKYLCPDCRVYLSFREVA